MDYGSFFNGGRIMKLIPTPQSFTKTEDVCPILGFAEILCQIPVDETIGWGLEQLKAAAANGKEVLLLQKADDLFFQEKNAREQGYILLRDSKGITLTAQTSVGFLYGLMTLVQLCKAAPREFSIYDRPQIRFRGNMNTLWAESGIWSYDFGDGLDAACQRLKTAIDQAARAKLNMMYVDAFGFRTERFPGYDKAMKEISDYGRVRGVYMMVGGYGMGYGLSALGDLHMGKVFRNRYPYPDGEIYDCIGRCGYDENEPVENLTGRSYGTCLSNDALTDDKIAEIRAYLRATGARLIYMHNVDADEIHEPLWRGRCQHCKERFPNDDLYAKDGAAGAFAAFYDRILDTLLPEFPDLIICPVSPGYAYAVNTNDKAFEKCRKFWTAILTYSRNAQALIPLFRELFHQWEDSRLRFDLLRETVPAFGCVYFSSGDGFYSDKIYTPSGAYAAAMKEADLIICANGSALQKPTQLTNAEYLWNPDHSAFYNVELADNFKDFFDHYNRFREGEIRPEGIYGKDGLLETACGVLFGEKYASEIADIFRIQGKNGECPIFTASNEEIWTRGGYVNLEMLWDTPAEPEKQETYRERFAECTATTAKAHEILTELLQKDLDAETRTHLAFLHESTDICGKICSQLTRYMELYIQADRFFANGVAVDNNFRSQCDGLIQDATKALEEVKAIGRKAFDPLGGIIWRQEELFDFIAYSTGQIIKSLDTNQRVPEDRRPLKPKGWW